MKIATVIKNLETYLEALSWTSTSGEGTTKFVAVYTYPNWVGTDGYPYVVILDSSGAGESIDNRNIEFSTNIDITLAVNYGTIDKSTEELQAEEAMLRLRESWDHLKTVLFDYTVMTTLGVDWSMEPNYVDDFDADLNLYKRKISLVVREIINRG